MRNLFGLLLISMVFGLAACGGGNSDSVSDEPVVGLAVPAVVNIAEE